MMAISSWLTPWAMEMLLVLPAPFNSLGFLLLVGPLDDEASAVGGSPILQDHLDGRKSMVDWQLGEIVAVRCVVVV